MHVSVLEELPREQVGRPFAVWMDLTAARQQPGFRVSCSRARETCRPARGSHVPPRGGAAQPLVLTAPRRTMSGADETAAAAAAPMAGAGACVARVTAPGLRASPRVPPASRIRTHYRRQGYRGHRPQGGGRQGGPDEGQDGQGACPARRLPAPQSKAACHQLWRG